MNETNRDFELVEDLGIVGRAERRIYEAFHTGKMGQTPSML